MPNARGFTLIEVLIVIAITALLAGLILTYTSSSRDQVALYVEQARLAQTVAKAKSLTISTYNNPTVPCGYGVSVDYANDTYLLFAYDAPSCASITFLNPDFQRELSTHRLPLNLQLPEPDAESVSGVLFTPPDPKGWIWLEASRTTSTEGRIPLASRGGNLTTSVSISSAGQISF